MKLGDRSITLLFFVVLWPVLIAEATPYTITTLDLPGIPAGINAAGQIVGSYSNGSRQSGYIEANGFLTTIDVPGADDTSVLGINNLGQIVGNYLVLSEHIGFTGGYHGFVESNGVFQTIDTPSSYIDPALSGINDSGELVGTYTDAVTRHGFLDVNGVFSNIDSGSPTFLNGINDSGQIVGLGGMGGFLLSEGVFNSLPNAAVPYGINNLGQTVGTYIVQPLGYGFVLANGDFTTLTIPDAANGVFPLSINDQGQVVGWYLDRFDNQHYFLATPTPEPSSLALMALGLATIGLVNDYRPATAQSKLPASAVSPDPL